MEVGEIQMMPDRQSLGIGSRVLQDTIAQMHAQNKSVTLSVGLKNHGAYRLYQRLGFREVARSDTHFHMSCDPHPSNQLTDHKP